MPTVAEIVSGIQAAGRFNAVAASEAEARDLLRRALPDAIELPAAIAGLTYPKPPAGCLKWFQRHPEELAVGHSRPHFKFVDWTSGKKGRGGSWGHIEF